MQSAFWSVTSKTELSVVQLKESITGKNNLILLEVKTFFWTYFNNYLFTITNKGS